MVRKTIQQELLASGMITQQQWDECVQEQASTGVSVDRCLLDKKYVDAKKLAELYAAYTGLPFCDAITDKMIDLDMLAKVPLAFLRQNTVIPVVFQGNPTILAAFPLTFEPLDQLNMVFQGAMHYAVAPAPIILDAINRHYPLEGAKQMIEELEEQDAQEAQDVAFDEIEGKDILAMASEAPIIKLVNHILFQAVKREASDIHIEPFEKEVRVRYRIDGVMYAVMSPPKRIQGSLISRIKIMAHLDIAEKRIPQDGRIQIKVADRAIDIRVSILPVAYGERVVMRLLDRTRSIAKLSELGLHDRDYRVLIAAISRPNGILYITGPTGSGKTSTLYSILSELNKPDVTIITVEDPVEYQIAGIGQVQVREKVGLTFASALRSILRQDPDIVMIGETRDSETAQIAIQASLTGHLVLSTLHTNSAPATITRLIDMGIEPFLIASSITVAVAQRLVRRLCPACKKEFTPAPELLAQLGAHGKLLKKRMYQAQGCDACLHTGYKGRLAIFEVMEMTDAIVQLTMRRAETGTIEKQAIADGMITLLDNGIRAVEQGITTIEEILTVASAERQAGE